jgi:hypothetical protein
MQLGKTIHRKLREEFLKYKLPQLKESYRDDYRHYLELEPFKAIEDKMVCEIKLGDLERVRNAIAVKHAKSGVHRAVTQSKRMLSWAWSFQAAFSGLEDVQYEWWLRWKFEYKTNERTRCPSIEEIARTLVIAERFRHLADGEHETYPSLTGITDEFVAGHRIEASAVEFFVQDSVIVIAHNAAFDRKFAERFWPVFERKAWGCSATEVEWRRHGFEGSRLGYLLSGAGFFSSATPGRRRLPRFSRNPRAGIADRRHAGAGAVAGAGPQKDDTCLGGAISL